MHQCYEPGSGRPSCIASLLADPRVLARIDARCEWEDGESDGLTALHLACDTHYNRYDVCTYHYDEDVVDWERAWVIEFLILAGADPAIPNEEGLRPLDTLRERDPDNASQYLLEHLACESIPSMVLKIRHQLDAARVVGAKIAGARALTEGAAGVEGEREGGLGKRVKTRASLAKAEEEAARMEMLAEARRQGVVVAAPAYLKKNVARILERDAVEEKRRKEKEENKKEMECKMSEDEEDEEEEESDSEYGYYGGRRRSPPLPKELPRVELRRLRPNISHSYSRKRLLRVLVYVVGEEGPEEGRSGGTKWGKRGLSPDLFVELAEMMDVEWGTMEELDEEDELEESESESEDED